MDTALELFAENGYHATSISQIAKKAHISKGLAYNYFKSKKELLDEIILTDIETFITNFDLNKDGILTEEEFEYFIRQSFKLVRENLRHWKLYFALMLQPKFSETFNLEYAKIAEPFLKMMNEFIESKGVADPHGDMMVISAMIEGALLYTVVAPDMFPSEVMEDKIMAEISRILNKTSTQ